MDTLTWERDERLSEDERQPSFYWYWVIGWAVAAGICLGFWFGVIFAIVEVTR